MPQSSQARLFNRFMTNPFCFGIRGRVGLVVLPESIGQKRPNKSLINPTPNLAKVSPGRFRFGTVRAIPLVPSCVCQAPPRSLGHFGGRLHVGETSHPCVTCHVLLFDRKHGTLFQGLAPSSAELEKRPRPCFIENTRCRCTNSDVTYAQRPKDRKEGCRSRSSGSGCPFSGREVNYRVFTECSSPCEHV